MKQPLILIFICFFISFTQLAAKTAEEWFIEGNIYAANENHPEAIDSFQKSLLENESANAHFNLANSYWATDEYAKSFFHLLKVPLIDPSHLEYKKNLFFITNQSGLSFEKLPQLKLIFPLSKPIWIWSLVFSFWFFIFLWLYPISRKYAPNIWNKFFRLFSLITMAISLFSLYQFEIYKAHGVTAKPKLDLKIAPTLNSPIQLSIDNLEVVQILNKENNFYYISLQDGTKGYLEEKSLYSLANSIIATD